MSEKRPQDPKSAAVAFKTFCQCLKKNMADECARLQRNLRTLDFQGEKREKSQMYFSGEDTEHRAARKGHREYEARNDLRHLLMFCNLLFSTVVLLENLDRHLS